MFGWLKPLEQIDETWLNKGLRNVVLDAVCSQTMGVLTGGAFLVAFALLLGASNKVIGIIAAIGPFAQILQIAAVFLVERIRVRKALVVVTAFFSRILWLLVAVLPWLLPHAYRIPLLLASLFVYFALAAVVNCAFGSWVRDLIPERIIGAQAARRMSIAIAVGAVLSLLAAMGIDAYKARATNVGAAYSALFLLGLTAGMLGIYFLSVIREEGEVEEKVVVTELYAEVRRTVASISNVPGIRRLTHFPYFNARNSSVK